MNTTHIATSPAGSKPRSWTPPAGAYWAGKWRNSASLLAVHDPEDDALISVVSKVHPQEVRQAVAALAEELDRSDWPLWERRAALERAADLLQTHSETIAGTIALESSKTIREARAEVNRATETLQLTTRATGSLSGEEIAFSDSQRGTDRFGWFTRAPIGVIAIISSFNDPLNLLVHTVGPALLGGNTVAIKPSPLTPLTALRLTSILLEAGVPARRLSTIPGNADTGRALVEIPQVRLVSFTGGHEAGERIAGLAGAKQVLMELGGNSPVIVRADADLAIAATQICQGSFGVAGQNCLSVQRVLVARKVRNQLLEALISQTEQLTVGPKLSEETDVGPLITNTASRRVERWVAEAVRAGATLCTGGTRNGNYYTPTILSNVPPHTRVWTNEIFGPVISVNTFDEDIDAVRAANNSTYGLHAGVFTQDIDCAFALARSLNVGAVMINDSSDFRLDSMPFGGSKESGIGRDGVRDTLLAMTQSKVIAIRTSSGTRLR